MTDFFCARNRKKILEGEKWSSQQEKKKKNDEKEGKLKNILGKKSVFLNKEKIKKSKTASDPQYTWGMFLYHFGIWLVRHEARKNWQLHDIFVLMYYTTYTTYTTYVV